MIQTIETKTSREATHMHQAYDEKEFGKKVESVSYLIYLFC